MAKKQIKKDSKNLFKNKAGREFSVIELPNGLMQGTYTDNKEFTITAPTLSTLLLLM